MKSAYAILIPCLFSQGCFSQSQESIKLQTGIYSGLNLSSFYQAGYPSSPLAGWKAGLLIGYDLYSKWRLSGLIGATFDKCHVNNPMMPISTQWKYLWADVTPLLSYLPFQRNNFQIAVGTGISVRKNLGTSVGNPSSSLKSSDAIYPWTYFLPVQLSGVFNLANGSRFGISAEYSLQLRRIYKPVSVNVFDYTNWTNKLQSWSLVVSYSMPSRRKSA